MPEKSKDIIEKSKKQARSFWAVMTTLGIILVAILVSMFFYKQKVEIEVPREVRVLNELTEGWNTLESEKYGFSLKYPKMWTVKEDSSSDGTIYIIKGNTEDGKSDARIVLSSSRKIKEDLDSAVQVSMPFGKNNYMIFAGHMDNPEKTSFYNMIATLKSIK